MAAAKTSEIDKQHPLKALAWDEINEPGAYVDISTGALYRVPPEALIEGATPVVEKQSESGSQLVRVERKPVGPPNLVRVSGNPYIFSLGARMLCIEHRIHPRF